MNKRIRITSILAVGLAAAAIAIGTVGAGGEERSADFGIDPGRADSALATIASNAPSPLRDVLKGGVTLKEYRAALERSAACYRDGVHDLAAKNGFDVPVVIGPIETSADDYRVSTSYDLDLRQVDP